MGTIREIKPGEHILIEGWNNYLYLSRRGIPRLEEAVALAQLKVAQAKKRRLAAKDKRGAKYVAVVCTIEAIEVEETLESHERSPKKPRPRKTDRHPGVRRAAPGKKVLGRGGKDE